jgi:nitrate reductase NapE component
MKNKVYNYINMIEKFQGSNKTEGISISEYKREKKKTSRRKTSILTILLIIILIILVLISGFIGKNFLNMFLFTLLFGFPLLILYKNKIIQQLPENIANWVVDEVEEVDEAIQTEVGFLTTPLYVRDYQIFIMGILFTIFAIYIIFKKKHRDKFVGLMTSLFFVTISSIFIIDIL